MKIHLFKNIEFDSRVNIVNLIFTVLIGVATYRVSYIQASIARNSELPNFQVVQELENNEGENYNKKIQVTNLDGRLRNYQSRAITYMNIKYYNSSNSEYINKSIPLEGYYYAERLTGQIQGLIETKTGYNNEKKIDEFNKEAQSKVNESDSLNISVISYIRIKYKNLLGEDVNEYYRFNNGANGKKIECNEGEFLFEKYEQLSKNKTYLDIDKLEFDNAINLLEDIENNEISDKLVNNDTDDVRSGKEMNNLASAFLGAVLGGILSYLGQSLLQRKKDQKKERHYCRLLYNDLCSIEYYLGSERGSVNIRYYPRWQDIIAECGNLEKEMIKELYDIYDKVYKYNYHWNLRINEKMNFRREDIAEYNQLREIFFDYSNGHINTDKHNNRYECILNEINS